MPYIKQNTGHWLYNTRSGKVLSNLFSLEWPFILNTYFIYFILIGVFFLTEFIAQTSVSVTFAVIVYVYSFGIIFYMLYVIISAHWYALDSDDAHENLDIFARNALISIALFYTTILLQNAILASAIVGLHPNAFVGISGDNVTIEIIGKSFFLALETTAALGTGAIFANPSSSFGFILIGIQSIETILVIAIAFPLIMAVIFIRISIKIKNKWKLGI